MPVTAGSFGRARARSVFPARPSAGAEPSFAYRGSPDERTKVDEVEAGARLMERVRARDVAAFEQLYDGYHRLVFGIALRMTSNAAIAEDVTQSIFLKLWSAPEAFREGNFSAWLSRVTRNRTLDAVRRSANRPTAEIPVDLPSEGSIEDAVFDRIDAQRVRGALSALDDDQRTPIELGFFGGITHEEIARRTGIPLGTIKTRIRTGLRRMRESLSEAVSR
jgi:RNA polymerase sigma-70 factor (ECF subfamily)